jgi:hypothetical protein
MGRRDDETPSPSPTLPLSPPHPLHSAPSPPPPPLALAANQCQISGGTSFVGTCAPNGGGTISYCSGTSCSAGCVNVFIPGPGACVNRANVGLAVAPNQAQSFSMTCGPVQQAAPTPAASQATPGPAAVPSLLPSTSTTNGAAATVMGGVAAAAGALAAALLMA